MWPVWRKVAFLGGAAILGVGTFAVSVILLHLLQPELDPWREAVSYYVHGRGGWLLSAGSAALWAACRLTPEHKIERTALGLLATWTVGVGLGGVFAADPPGQWDRPPSAAGAIHGLAAMAAFTAIPIAAWLVSRQLRNSLSPGRGKLLRGLAAGVAISYVVFMASLAPVFVTSGPPWLMGFTERVLLVGVCAWLAAAALALSRRRG
jgi:hypothetical protein